MRKLTWEKKWSKKWKEGKEGEGEEMEVRRDNNKKKGKQ